MSKRDNVARARGLLDSGKDSDLPYAALELRFAMESIIYEKLRLYSPRLPASVLDKWQPPQAMKALVQIEPRAGSDKVMRFREELEEGPGEWHSMGQHLTFKIDWLTKNYNKLGGYLHTSSIRASANAPSPDAAKQRAELRVILAEVERVASSTTDSNLASVTEFPCQICGKAILCNTDGLLKTLRATCTYQSCGAEHIMVKHEDDLYYPNIDGTGFDCIKCKAITVLEHRKLKVGLKFQCATCKTEHLIANKQWKYLAKIDDKEPEEMGSHWEAKDGEEPAL